MSDSLSMVFLECRKIFVQWCVISWHHYVVLDMSQGYLLVHLTHKRPQYQDMGTNTNKILTTKGRIPPSIQQDHLARPGTPAGPTGKITCTAWSRALRPEFAYQNPIGYRQTKYNQVSCKLHDKLEMTIIMQSSLLIISIDHKNNLQSSATSFPKFYHYFSPKLYLLA